jgi:hypothetical protein
MHEVDVIASGSIHDAMQTHECCCSTSSSHFTTPITTISLLLQEQQEEEPELEAVKFLFYFFRNFLTNFGAKLLTGDHHAMQSFFVFFSLFKIEILAIFSNSKINRIYTHNTGPPPPPISKIFFCSSFFCRK